MIAKGGARADPRQLGPYLMRTGRYDTGEKARLLEFRSPWSASRDLNRERTAGLLNEAFCDWQTWCEGTKQGEHGLYHAQISPAPKYAKTMTDAQWLRCADILEEELGFKGQDRVVAWQEGKDGRHHLHIAWARTDIDTMKVISDSNNYYAHERASMRMEQEFGHEFVAGKHAKRDRKNQKEFPRADSTYDDHMQAARTSMSVEERRAQITGIRQNADNAEAFKNALEEAGYVLARGDRRKIVVVDEHGEVFSLSKQVTDIKGDAYKKFMAPIDEAKLPSVDDAKALQKLHAVAKQEIWAEKKEYDRIQAEAVSKSDGTPEAPRKDKEKGAEASKFLEGEAAKNLPEPFQTPEIATPKPAIEKREPEPIDPERKQQITTLRAWSDGAQAFKRALEEAGYTLARGETGYVLMSEEGVFSLARHAGLGKFQLETFMSPIPLNSLPDVKELIEAQKQARFESNIFGKEIELPPPPQPSLLPRKEPQLATRMELSALDMAAQAIAEAERARQKTDLDALEEALAKRHQQEAAKLQERHDLELRMKEVEMDRTIARDMENFIRIQDEQKEAFLQARKDERSGLKGLIQAAENRWNPALGEARAKQREEDRKNFYRRLAKERKDYEVLILQNKQLEIENLIERQRLQRDDLKTKSADDRERRIGDYHDAERMRAEIEAQRQKEELERNESLRDGPPPPELGKS